MQPSTKIKSGVQKILSIPLHGIKIRVQRAVHMCKISEPALFKERINTVRIVAYWISRFDYV
jgi:hypothetical protein